MDPNQPKTPDQNLPVPETSEASTSYMDNVNKPQTPAYNNTDYWNQATQNVDAKITEPVNPPEPLAPAENPTPTYTEPAHTESVNPIESQTPAEPQPEPESIIPETPSQTVDSNEQKWDSTPVPTESSNTSETPPTPVSTPPTPPAEPPVSSSPDSSNTMKIVVAVTAIVLLSVAGLFAFQYFQSKAPVAVVSPTPVATLEAVATPDPYASWETYTNQKYGFSFKYPPIFKAGTATDKDAYWSYPTGDAPLGLGDSGYWLDLRVYSSTTAGDRAIYDEKIKLLSLEENKSLTIGAVGAQTIYTRVNSPNSNIVLFDTSTGKGTPEPAYSRQSIVKLNDTTILSLTFGVLKIETLRSSQSLFDQILSTFKLTSASPSASPIAAGTCDKGYKAFAGNGYSLCYPETLVKTASSTSSEVVFENANETLKVKTNFQGGWGGSPCLFIDKTTVAGYASKRLSWKTEQATGGGCDNTFTSFAEMVNEGNFKFPFPYVLELTSKNTPFQDNSEFLTIEKSFQVTNPSPTPNGS